MMLTLTIITFNTPNWFPSLPPKPFKTLQNHKKSSNTACVILLSSLLHRSADASMAAFLLGMFFVLFSSPKTFIFIAFVSRTSWPWGLRTYLACADSRDCGMKVQAYSLIQTPRYWHFMTQKHMSFSSRGPSRGCEGPRQRVCVVLGHWSYRFDMVEDDRDDTHHHLHSNHCSYSSHSCSYTAWKKNSFAFR